MPGAVRITIANRTSSIPVGHKTHGGVPVIVYSAEHHHYHKIYEPNLWPVLNRPYTAAASKGT
jgi:hypothetical protein